MDSPVPPAPPAFTYIFLDEGGNFDFSANGTTYFVLTALTMERPFAWDADLMALKYDELERGSAAEYFHAADDKQIVRDRVFMVIARHMSGVRVDSLIVPKRKVVPPLRVEEKFYPRMLGYLLRYVVQREAVQAPAELIIMTDAVPVKAKRKAIAKAVEETLADMLPSGTSYRINHHDSKSCVSPQSSGGRLLQLGHLPQMGSRRRTEL